MVFDYRIADMMVDLLPPNFDYQPFATNWKNALNDLKNSSPDGEITHVQMRIFWSLLIDEFGNVGDNFITPKLGSTDGQGGEWGGQWSIMRRKMTSTNNQIPPDPNTPIWKRWYFGVGVPLAYGPCASKQIHDAGLKMELAISGAWGEGPTGLAKPGGSTANIGGWGQKESSYPSWISAGSGDKFLDNYMNNVVRPVAQFLASLPNELWGDGDIFHMSFEMNYPTADFTWNHNTKWKAIISEVRQIFNNAGKSGVKLTIDHCGWYDDFGLGYDAVKLLNPSATLSSSNKGISGALYLADLDFISYSHWLPLILQSEMKDVWSDSDILFLTNHWFSNPNFYKVGTGYNAVPGVMGRDIIADCRALSQVMGKKVLMNTGWESRHGVLCHAPQTSGGGVPDNMEQRVAWASQLEAISDDRSIMESWCCGQDFERYCENKSSTVGTNSSWRNSPAQQKIIELIKTMGGDNVGSKNIGGSVSNQATSGEIVTITITKPDNTIETITTQTLSDKSYKITYTGNAGTYKAKATIAEDTQYQGATSTELTFTLDKDVRTITIGIVP